MLNKLTTLCLLFPFVLVGCGVANTDQPLVEPPEDVTSPRIESIQFDKAQISGVSITLNDLSLQTITIRFSEALDAASLEGAFSIEGLPGSWAYNAEDNSVVFTVDAGFKLEYNQQYQLAASGEIKDQAGNTLLSGDYQVTVNTPSAFQVNARIAGLKAGETLGLNLSSLAGDRELTLTGDSQESATFDLLIPSGNLYQISLGALSSNQICTGEGSFSMGNRDATVMLNCSSVFPLYVNAPNWNDYLSGARSTSLAADQGACDNSNYRDGCFHGAEHRVYPLSSVSSCDGLEISDELDVFDWTCQLGDQGEAQAVSMGLKAGKGLTDLLSFVNPADSTDDSYAAWAPNRVIIKNASGNTIEQSEDGIWWNNPVIAAASIMDQAGAIYVYSKINYDRSVFNSNNVIGKIGLVIKPGIQLRGSVDFSSPSVSNPKNFLWLEGDIDANGADIALKLANTRYAHIRDLSVVNAAGNGIDLSGTRTSSFANVLKGIAAVHNGGHGISLNDGQANKLINVQLANNNGSGLVLNKGRDTVISGVNSNNNGEHGLLLDEALNASLTLITSSGNGGDGVQLGGNSQIAAFNFLASITSSANLGNGLNLVDSSGVTNNRLENINSALNGDAGIEMNNISNSISNALVMLNAINCSIDGGSDCPAEVGEFGDSGLVFVEASSDVENDKTFAMASGGVRVHSAIDDSFNPIVAERAPNRLARWTRFENANRAWMCDATGSCQIMDWSLRQDAAAGLGSDQIAGSAATHTFYRDINVDYLPNAIELFGDGIGNDNGLCEVNESCLLSPNIGSYQGHGDLMGRSLGDTETTPFPVDLKVYSTNGY